MQDEIYITEEYITKIIQCEIHSLVFNIKIVHLYFGKKKKIVCLLFVNIISFLDVEDVDHLEDKTFPTKLKYCPSSIPICASCRSA